MSVKLIKEVLPLTGGFIIGKYAVKTGLYFLNPNTSDRTKNCLEIISGLIGMFFAGLKNIHEGKIRTTYFKVDGSLFNLKEEFDHISDARDKCYAIKEMCKQSLAFDKLLKKVNVCFLVIINFLLNLAGGAAAGKYLTKSCIYIYNIVANNFFGENYRMSKGLQQSMENLGIGVGCLSFSYQAFVMTKDLIELLVYSRKFFGETLNFVESAFKKDTNLNKFLIS